MAQIITSARVWSLIPVRRASSHKGTYGSTLLVAGSEGYRGAPLLCAEGAARIGAGIVTLASVESVLPAAVARLPECCLLPCAQENGCISAKEAARILEKANAGTALAIGPGLGDAETCRPLVLSLIAGAQVPLVLDADGLNAVAGLGPLPHPESGAPMILTPHPGEMSHLTGLPVETIQAAREEIASLYAQKQNCILVLKGSHTLIAAPDGTVYENQTGNPGLARGGSGDILTGMIAGLLAQKLKPLAAAYCAVWLHGSAADLAAEQYGQYGMLPHDIFAQLGRLFSESGR
jgi:ADP-dependent NAD(P)H-hydrate dehydratase